MTNEEWIEMFNLIPTDQHNQLVLTLQNGTDLVVEIFFKFEPNFLVMRGRQGGSIDESRAFFVPYSQLLYFRIERVVKLKELYAIFGEEAPEHVRREGATPGEASNETEAPASGLRSKIRQQPVDTSGLNTNLLERIRAARAGSVASPPRQASKGE